jgi:hypothetical protein
LERAEERACYRCLDGGRGRGRGRGAGAGAGRARDVGRWADTKGVSGWSLSDHRDDVDVYGEAEMEVGGGGGRRSERKRGVK